jgi:hypothetical protein
MQLIPISLKVYAKPAHPTNFARSILQMPIRSIIVEFHLAGIDEFLLVVH